MVGVTEGKGELVGATEGDQEMVGAMESEREIGRCYFATMWVWLC